jgi:hypothetical protein
MSDIYEIKARKYKLKYYKLKKQLEGGFLVKKKLEGGFLEEFYKYFYTYNKNCMTKPPISLQGLTLTQEYPELSNQSTQIDLDQFNDREHFGQLLSYKDDIYKKEFNNFKLVNSFDKDLQYTSVLKFAGYMEKQKFIDYIKDKIRTIKNNKDETYTSYNYMRNCQYTLIDDKDIKNYGYIINTYTGIPFNEMKKEDINDQNIIQILKNLKEGIDNFIKPLYNAGYVLGDIKMENMTCKDNKIYFINYSKMHKYEDKYDVKKFAKGDNYSYILPLFFKISEDDNKENVDKEFLMRTFNNGDIDNPQSIIFNDLIKDTMYSINDIYQNYIMPIAINSDIYALSMFIHSIFAEDFFAIGLVIRKITNEILQKLHKEAISNQIYGPIDLSNRLQQIIDSIEIISGLMHVK